jgi:hypothetical protein
LVCKKPNYQVLKKLLKPKVHGIEMAWHKHYSQYDAFPTCHIVDKTGSLKAMGEAPYE